MIGDVVSKTEPAGNGDDKSQIGAGETLRSQTFVRWEIISNPLDRGLETPSAPISGHAGWADSKFERKMVHIAKWKIYLVLIVCFLGLVFASPNLLDRQLDRLPG